MRDVALPLPAAAGESYVTDIKFDLEAESDGKPYHFDSLLDVIVKDTRIFGGEWVLDPDTRADDGVFELIPIAGRRDSTSSSPPHGPRLTIPCEGRG